MYGVSARNVGDVGFVSMPQDTLDYMNRVEEHAASLDRDILRSPIPLSDPSFGLSWGAWLGNWRGFYAAHLPWMQRWGGAVWDQTAAFERDLIGWRKAFISRGGKATAPEPRPPGGGLPSLSDLSNLIVVAVLGYLAIKHL